MKTPRADRPIPLALTALVAFVAALAAANGHDGQAHGNPATHAPMTVAASSDATTAKAVERRHAGAADRCSALSDPPHPSHGQPAELTSKIVIGIR
jgi:hypothetical protein